MSRCPSSLSPLVTLAAAVVTAGLAGAQVAPGLRTFGTDDFVEVVPGSLPVVISAGHGGGLRPTEIPDRSYGVTTSDLNTERVARELAAALAARTGRLPHVVISHLHRIKLDPNREVVEAAQGDPRATLAWNEYHAAILRARQQVTATWGRGLYVDVHGHGHAIQRIEWGYGLDGSDYLLPDPILDTSPFVLRSTLRSAASRPGALHSSLLRGASSFGGLMEARGYAGVPSPTNPAPGSAPYFDGGYSVRRWGSRDGGTVDGVQIELHGDVRRDANTRRAMVDQLAASIVVWLDRNLGVDATAGTRVTVRALDPVTTESGAPAWLRVERTAPFTAPLQVTWSVSGSALQATDYDVLPSSVTILPGHAFVDVPVVPHRDALDEGDEVVRVQLFGGAEIGWPASAAIVIRDDGDEPRRAGAWPLDVRAAGVTPDTSGRGRDAALLPSSVSGPVLLATAVVGAGLSFDGHDDALRVVDHDYAPNGAFTLAFWFRTPPPASGASGFRYVASHGAFGAPSSLNVYFIESSRTLRSYLQFANGRSPTTQLDVPDGTMDGAWHHYALSATPRGLAFVAIDGEVRSENPHAGDRYDPSGPLYLGARSDLDPARYFPGALDDVHLIGRALTIEEVRALRSARLGAVRPYGAGCPSAMPPRIAATGRPEHDRRIGLDVDGAPSAPAFIGFGLRDDLWFGRPLPFALDVLGAPGCALLHDLVDALGAATDSAGHASIALTVPRDPGLVGRRLYAQTFVLSPGANPLGLTATSALELTFGGQL